LALLSPHCSRSRFSEPKNLSLSVKLQGGSKPFQTFFMPSGNGSSVMFPATASRSQRTEHNPALSVWPALLLLSAAIAAFLLFDIDGMRNALAATNRGLDETNLQLRTTNSQLRSMINQLRFTNQQLSTTNSQLRTTNSKLQLTNAQILLTNVKLDGTNKNLLLMSAELESMQRDLSQMARKITHAKLLF
jgi:septal ring factor EnvC (AmiA/AmiB activator)